MTLTRLITIHADFIGLNAVGPHILMVPAVGARAAHAQAHTLAHVRANIARQTQIAASAASPTSHDSVAGDRLPQPTLEKKRGGGVYGVKLKSFTMWNFIWFHVVKRAISHHELLVSHQ